MIYLVLFLGGGNESRGYQYSMYLLAGLLVGFLLITFFSTRERVKPVRLEQGSVTSDLKDLLKNRPWVILLFVGFLFVIFNSII